LLCFYRDSRTKKFPAEKHHPVKIHLNVPLKSSFIFIPLGSAFVLLYTRASCRVRTNLEQGKIMSTAEICFKPLNRKIQQHSDGDKCERESMLHPFPAAAFSSGTGGLFTYAARRRWRQRQHSPHTHTPRQHAVSSEKWLD
jgi:hypothetical protein